MWECRIEARPIWFDVRWWLATTLFTFASCLNLHAQETGGGPGGGGGLPTTASLQISASHPNDVLMGTTVVLTGSVINGSATSPLYERKGCSAEIWETKPSWSSWTIGVCADCEGTTVYRLNATSNSEVIKTTYDLVVVGPNQIAGVQSTFNSVSTAGNPKTVVHKFHILRNGTKIGPCVSLCVSERAIFKSDQGFPSLSGVTWQPWKCGTEDPLFLFTNGEIHDTKAYVASPSFASWPDGYEIDEYVQQVKVQVPVCCGSAREVASSEFRFKIIKVAPDKVKHVLVQ